MERKFFRKLTQQEKDIIREVDGLYFFTRCIPLSLGAILGARYLMTKGIVSTRGSIFKQTVAGFGGFMIGKIAGNNKRRERIRNEVPDGYLATLMKEIHALSDEEKKQYFRLSQLVATKEYDLPSVVLYKEPSGKFQRSFPPSEQEIIPTGQMPQFTDERTGSSRQDTSERHHSIFERLQPSSTPDINVEQESDTTVEGSDTRHPGQKQQFSYSAQREKWLEGQGQSYKPESGGHESIPVKEDAYSSTATSGQTRPRKNKYGDEME